VFVETEQYETVGQKIARRIILTENHWIWPGGKTGPNGYARVYIYDRNVMLHQVTYEAMFGVAPPGRMYNRCGVQSCLNPAHWQIGLHKEARTPLTFVVPDHDILVRRIAEILDQIAEQAASPCVTCGSGLTVHERRHAEVLRDRGYKRSWADICETCRQMYLQTARNKRRDRDQQIIAWAKRGRAVAWIAERYIGGETAAATQKVIDILLRYGYTVGLSDARL
jgi:hypothetical protein